MTIHPFRIAAMTIIGFNLLGTFLTWGFHLQQARIGAAHAIAQGTQFTGPLVLVAIAIVALGLTYTGRKPLGFVGVFLIGLWGAGFSIGELSEFFQKRVGISSGKWDVILVGSAIGIAIGLTTAVLAIQLLVSRRRQVRATTPATA